MSGLWGVNGRGKSSSLQGKDTHLLGMEYLGLSDLFRNGGRDRRHGKNHGGELLVEPEEKLVDEGNIVRDTCLRGNVLEVGNVLLESIVQDTVRAFERFLSELGELEAGSCLSVIGEKYRFEVGCKFVKGLFGIGDRGIHHLVIPHF